MARDGKFKEMGTKNGCVILTVGTYAHGATWIGVNRLQTNGLTRATIQGVNQPHLLELAEEVLNSHLPRTTYEAEPPDTKEIEDETLISELVQLGLRPGAAEELTQALRRIRLLARFYLGRPWELTNEHDARTFLVVPLLIALGWAEQRMKIELSVPGVGRVDIGCFSKPFSGRDDQCIA